MLGFFLLGLEPSQGNEPKTPAGSAELTAPHPSVKEWFDDELNTPAGSDELPPPDAAEFPPPGARAMPAPSPPRRNGIRLENAGWSLIGLGAPMMVGGAAYYAAYQRAGNACSEDPKCDGHDDGFGAFLLAVTVSGGLMGLTGSIMVPAGRRVQRRTGGLRSYGTPGWILIGHGLASVAIGALYLGLEAGEVGWPILGVGTGLLGAGVPMAVLGQRRGEAEGGRSPWRAVVEIPGWIMTGVGGLAIVGGVVLEAGSNPRGGPALITAGAGIAAVGIPLGVAGRRTRLGGVTRTAGEPQRRFGLRSSLSVTPTVVHRGLGIGVLGRF